MLRPPEKYISQSEPSKHEPEVVDILEMIRLRYWLNAATYSPDPEDPNKFYDWPY